MGNLRPIANSPGNLPSQHYRDSNNVAEVVADVEQRGEQQHGVAACIPPCAPLAGALLV